MPFPPANTSVTIFPSMPDADQATFSGGIPAIGTNNQELAVILYSPNLQIVASMDNTNSDAECAYAVSVATGFTFTSTESVSISATVGVNVEIVTASVTTTFALSFSEQWNTTRTVSMTFTCPAGKQAFVYQGTLLSRQLAFNAATGAYTWASAEAAALTELLLTSRTPVGKAPSNTVNISSS